MQRCECILSRSVTDLSRSRGSNDIKNLRRVWANEKLNETNVDFVYLLNRLDLIDIKILHTLYFIFTWETIVALLREVFLA